MIKVECPRCLNGKGFISAFKHVQGGVCFKCKGQGFVTCKTKPAQSFKFWAMQKFDENEGFINTFSFKAKNENEANKKLQKKLGHTGREFFAKQA
jgi:hypothetical protein